MGAVEGARAVGLGDEVGPLKTGKRADRMSRLDSQKDV
jgi:imidazolonepropionase-like amidohydrolase